MFDESKVPVFLFIAAVIVVVSFVAHHLQLVDEANALLHESKHKLTSMEETITLRRIMLASIEKAKAAFDKESVRESELERKKAELETRHRRLEGIINSSVESLRAMVGKVRQEALNTTLGDITLKSGRILRAAKISKFDDSSLTFIHADGVSTVTTDQLDAELVSRYDLGESALLPQALLSSLASSTHLNPPALNQSQETALRRSPRLPRAKRHSNINWKRPPSTKANWKSRPATLTNRSKAQKPKEPTPSRCATSVMSSKVMSAWRTKIYNDLNSK